MFSQSGSSHSQFTSAASGHQLPLVSVIIPVYNGDRYLTEALESVLNQTYCHCEVIAVDDGSTDGSRVILQSYGDRIQSLYQTNQGVAAARNAGIQIAQGELIAFLDQDDCFLPDKLAVQVAALTASPSLGFVSSGWQIVNEDTTVSEVRPWEGIPALTSTDWIVWKPVFLGAMLFRREWLERAEGFNLHLQQTPDLDLILRLAQLGCASAWVNQATVRYRQHANNASRNALQQAAEIEAVLEQFFTQPELPLSLQQLEPRSRYQSLVWSAWRLYHLGNVAEMAHCLRKSLRYTTGAPTETLLDWIDSFQRYASEYGCKLDSYALTQSKEWQTLVRACLSG